MKIKSGYMMREVAGSYVVVPIGSSLDFSGVMTLNETGAFLWKQLETEKNENELMVSMLEEYDIDEATLKKDIVEFISKLKAAKLFE